MQEHHKITEKESFDNYLDYKDVLEYKYSKQLGTKNMKAVYYAALDEMKEKKLINDEFYENETETISFLGDDDTCKDCIYLSLATTFITLLFSLLGLLVIYEMEELKMDTFDEL